MLKRWYLFCALISVSFLGVAQNFKDFKVGAIIQKTQSFYWENGLGVEYQSNALLNNHLHLNMSFLTSRLGTAMLYENAIAQDQVNVGVDWHFGVRNPLQFFVGLQTGYFKTNFEEPMFDVLPQASALFAAHLGLSYDIDRFSIKTKLGYHLINGDGFDVPGTLFPVYYQFAVFYRL